MPHIPVKSPVTQTVHEAETHRLLVELGVRQDVLDRAIRHSRALLLRCRAHTVKPALSGTRYSHH